MGSDEQISTSGKTVNDYAESKKRLANLMAEMTAIADAFAELSKFIRSAHATAYINAPKVDKIPTQERFRQLAVSIGEEFDRKQRLAKSLRDMGVDVQEDSGFLTDPTSRGPRAL